MEKARRETKRDRETERKMVRKETRGVLHFQCLDLFYFLLLILSLSYLLFTSLSRELLVIYQEGARPYSTFFVPLFYF